MVLKTQPTNVPALLLVAKGWGSLGNNAKILIVEPGFTLRFWWGPCC